MATQQQFEFCHRMLGEVLSGKVEWVEETDAPGRQRTGWRRIFGGRKKKSSQSNHGNQILLIDVRGVVPLHVI